MLKEEQAEKMAALSILMSDTANKETLSQALERQIAALNAEISTLQVRVFSLALLVVVIQDSLR